ncbi:serine hydrolase domain-containing protein [Streptomyces sp. NPDC056738]|uniref:serine hydrolase domain-containing protein n=1 Tax=Streptomyces sp. NPDC056738 TaxID=3345933 RepID=UPI0036BF5D6B
MPTRLPRSLVRPRRASAPTRRRSRLTVLLSAAVLALTPVAPALATPTAVGDVHHPKAGAPPFANSLTPDLIALMQRLRIPGAVVSIRTPQWGTWTKTLGTESLKTGKPIAADEHFRIGSITKTFTATVILELVDEGRIKLDAPVSRYLRGVPNGRNITVRQLLQMTSGLYNYSEDLRFNQVLDDRPETQWRPEELLAIAFRHQPYFPPGQGWHYSNTNYILLGLIAEKLTHRPLTSLLRDRVFRPVGMPHTNLATDTAFPAPHPRGYQFISNVDSLTAPVLTGKDAAWADWSAGNPMDVTDVNPSWAWAAGGGISTLSDLLRWAPALADGKLLSPQTQRQRLRFVPTSDVPGTPTYGLGIVDFSGFLGHDGQIPGYNSFVGYDPKRKATVVVLVNLNQSPDGTAPSDELTKLILSEVFGVSPS